MNCREVKTLLSEYLDGSVPGSRMHAIAGHLEACAECRADFRLLQQTHGMVAALGRKKAPADLALRLRVALSQERARQRAGAFERLLVRVDNVLNPLMFPATAGLLTAVVIFGLLIGFFALPARLSAADDSVFYTPPQLRASSPFLSTDLINEDSIVIAAEVDAQGRVQDYSIVSAPAGAQQMLPQLNNVLIFTVFRPATSFGQPTNGRVVLSFSRINVKG